MHKNNSGFTLVEVLVVVVILVVLATLIIPSMVTYLTKSNDEKNQGDAKDIFSSAQLELYNLYSEGTRDNREGGESLSIIEGEPDISYYKFKYTFSYDNTQREVSVPIVDINNKKTYLLSKKIFTNIGIKVNVDKNNGRWKSDMPCCVLLITGNYSYYCNPLIDTYDPQKAYTLYGLVFCQNIAGDMFVLLKNGNILYPHSPEDLDKIVGNIIEDDKADTPVSLEIYCIKGWVGDDVSAINVWKLLHKTYGDNTAKERVQKTYNINSTKQDVIN